MAAVDVDKFAKALRDNAEPESIRKCAAYVRMALEAGGGKTKGHPFHARQWGPMLLRMGFRELPVEKLDTYKPLKGDIAVIQPYKGGNDSGHMAGFDGKDWISDFFQRDFWGGPGYRRNKPPHVFYRP